MLNQIKRNLQQFYKMKIAIKEAFDFVKVSSNNSMPFFYKLLEEPQDMLSYRCECLEEMFFCFRNNNKMMLTLINNCPNNNNQYETLSYFIVHCFYENILNSTFVQEDMLVLFYLLLEDLIANKDDFCFNVSKSFYLEGTFLFEMFKSLALKEDIRAYLSVILNKVVNKLENITDGVLTVNVNEIEEYMKKRQCKGENEANKRKHKQMMFNYDNDNTKSPEEYIKSQHVNLGFLKEYLNVIENQSEQSVNAVQQEIDFIKSNIEIFETVNNGRNSNNNGNVLLNKINNKNISIKNELVSNIKKTIYLLDMLIKNLLENISTIPYTIKCICKIINTLITFKYESTLTSYEKLSFTISFFFECILIPILLNPNQNGVIITNIIPSNVKQSLITITTILKQIHKGILFTPTDKDRSAYTIFNMFIIQIIPNIIKLFSDIQSTKLPTALEKLISNRNNPNRDINYNYFKHNHTENITHQSVCFNWENVLTFIKIIKDNKNVFIEIEPNMKNVFEKVIQYENDFNNLISKSIQGSIYEAKGMSIKIKEIHFVYFGKVIFKEEFKAILDGKKNNCSLNNAFSFTSNLASSSTTKKQNKKENVIKDITDNKPNVSLIDTIKKSLCGILQYVNIISKENFDINDINEVTDSFDTFLLPKIIKMVKCEISNYNTFFFKNKNKGMPIVYLITFLEKNLQRLSDNYKKDNYSLLFNELLRECEMSLQNTKNDVINQIYLKVKNSDKLNMIINNNLSQLKQLEKILTVEHFVDLLKIEVKLEYVKTNNKIVSISLNKNCSNCSPENKITSIKKFIELFPSFTNINDADPIEYEEQIEVDKVTNSYFALIKQNLKTNERMLRFNHEEFIAVNEAIQDYVMANIHDKLVPYSRTKKDIFIYNKCKRLNWIKPIHIIKDQKVVNEKLWTLAMEYINNMDNEITPSSKIKSFNKAFAILQNSITFCTGKDELGVDDSLQVLIYVIIKAQPKRIWTNFNYARLFIDPDLSKKQFGLLLTQLEMVLTVISNLKYTDLVGVSEEQFGVDDKMEDIQIENDEY